MTKKPRHKPLRFLVTGALLLGPALQACDDYDEPTGNELAPDPGVEAPEPGVAPPEPGVEPPDEEEPPPETEVLNPGIDAPVPEGVGSIGEAAAAVMGTNAVAPPRPVE